MSLKDSVSCNTKKNRKKSIWHWAQVSLGLLAFGILFAHVDLEIVFVAISQVDWGLILWIVPISVFLHIWTWLGHVYLLKAINRPQPLVWFLRVFLLVQSIALIIPGKLGDLSLTWFLKKRRLPYSESIAVVMHYKVVAFFLNIWLGLLGFALGFGEMSILLISLLIPAFAIFLWVRKHCALPLFVVKYMAKGRMDERLDVFYNAWQQLSSPTVIAGSLLLAGVKILIMAVKVWILLLAYNESLSLGLIILLQAVVRLVLLVPITPAGIGVRELSSTALFAMWAGVPQEIMVSALLMALLIEWLIKCVFYFFNIKLFDSL